MIRVAIADDEVFVRMGLRVLIEREADLELVGEAVDGTAALELTRDTRPDVLLLDVRMPGMDGIEVLRAITSDPALDATRVVIVTTFEIDQYVVDALQAGASGFLVKERAPQELIAGVRAAASGDALLSPSVTRRVLSLFSRHVAETSRPAAMDHLTEREREIMAWVATGRSNDEIASELYLSPATVRTHVGRAITKLAARDRAQLVVLAIRAGLTLPM
jgi:DNA-binding NarL/FixJ family response regulator